MGPQTSRALRSIAFGAVAACLSYVAGFVVPTLQNPLTLTGVFALVVAAAMMGLGRIAETVQLHARLSVVVFAVVVMVLPLVVLWLVMPTYITPVGLR